MFARSGTLMLNSFCLVFRQVHWKHHGRLYIDSPRTINSAIPSLSLRKSWTWRKDTLWLTVVISAWHTHGIPALGITSSRPVSYRLEEKLRDFPIVLRTITNHNIDHTMTNRFIMWREKNRLGHWAVEIFVSVWQFPNVFFKQKWYNLSEVHLIFVFLERMGRYKGLWTPFGSSKDCHG